MLNVISNVVQYVLNNLQISKLYNLFLQYFYPKCW